MIKNCCIYKVIFNDLLLLESFCLWRRCAFVRTTITTSIIASKGPLPILMLNIAITLNESSPLKILNKSSWNNYKIKQNAMQKILGNSIAKYSLLYRLYSYLYRLYSLTARLKWHLTSTPIMVFYQLLPTFNYSNIINRR